MLSSIITKFKNIPNPIMVSLGYIITKFFRQGLGIISMPIFTRILSKEDFGTVSIYFSWASIAITLITLNIHAGFYKNAIVDFGKKSKKLDEITSSMLTLCSIIAVFFFVFSLIFRQQITNITNLPFRLIAFMYLCAITALPYKLWVVRQRFLYRYKLATVLSLTIALSSVTAGLIGVLNAPADSVIFARIFFSEAPLIILGLIFFVILIVKGKTLVNISHWKHALCFSLPLVPQAISVIVLAQSDKIMIVNLLENGSESVALYSVAYNIALGVQVLFLAINTSWIPFTYKNLKAEKYPRIEKYTTLLVAAVLALFLIVVCFAPEILAILAAPIYQEAVWVIPPVILSVFFMFVYSLFVNVQLYHKKTVPIMFASIAAAILNIILNLIFIPIFGYIAAAYTTLLGYATLCVAYYILMRRANSNRIYNIKALLALTSIAVVGSFLIMLTYQTTILRYLIALAIVAMCFAFRKKIISAFAEIKRKKNPSERTDA